MLIGAFGVVVINYSTGSAAIGSSSFGNGMPIGTFWGSPLFGFIDAVAMKVQLYGFQSQLVQILLYLVTIMTLVAVALYKKRKKKGTLN